MIACVLPPYTNPHFKIENDYIYINTAGEKIKSSGFGRPNKTLKKLLQAKLSYNTSN